MASTTRARAEADVPLLATAVLDRFVVAAPELISTRALLRRFDRKYLVSSRSAGDFLSMLSDDYQVLHAGVGAVARYRTEYFDTPDLRAYEDHRRGRLPRCKIRMRHHLDRAMTFLEVKRKQPDGQTAKMRQERPFGSDELGDDGRQFIERHSTLQAARVTVTASVEFLRISFVGVRSDERVTIDCALAIGHGTRRERFDSIAIVEVKQARFSARTPVVSALRVLRARERALSKYCLALARLAPVKSNTFRPTLRAMERLSV